MSTLALLLALLSAVRPTSLAAVYAILGSPRPRRLLLVFNIAGLAVTITVGIVLVIFLKKVGRTSQESHDIAALVLAAACFAGAGAFRRRPVREGEHEARETTRRVTARLRDPSVPTVAAAGVLTHLPGLVYLIALNAIIATNPTVAIGLLAVLVYNAIWFAIPLLSLALAIVWPDRTSEFVKGISDWTRRHQRTLVPLVLSGLGVYLLVKGLTGLL